MTCEDLVLAYSYMVKDSSIYRYKYLFSTKNRDASFVS